MKKDIDVMSPLNRKHEDRLYRARKVISIIDGIRDLFAVGKNYSVGDVITVDVNDEDDDGNPRKQPLLDSVGIKKKFMIVAKSRQSGVSVVQRLDLKGKPYGQCYLLSGSENIFFWPGFLECISLGSEWEPMRYAVRRDSYDLSFRVDEDLEDSILTGEEYDPGKTKREKVLSLKEVKKHNDSVRLNTSWEESKKLIRSMKKGQIYWTSPSSYFLVNSTSRSKRFVRITRNTSNSIEILNASHVFGSRLYRDRPKTYK
jgi:hypothetical protein